MTARELAAVWAGSLMYTAYVVVLAFLLPPLFGGLGVVAFFVLALGPVIGMSFWMLRGGA